MAHRGRQGDRFQNGTIGKCPFADGSEPFGKSEPAHSIAAIERKWGDMTNGSRNGVVAPRSIFATKSHQSGGIFAHQYAIYVAEIGVVGIHSDGFQLSASLKSALSYLRHVFPYRDGFECSAPKKRLIADMAHIRWQSQIGEARASMKCPFADIGERIGKID